MADIVKIGFFALQLLQEQIKQGIDENGKPYKYSTRPFARPFTNKIKNQRQLKNDGKISVTTTKSGKRWMVITGGYRSYRELIGRNPDGDFLQDSGAMLQSLTVKKRSATDAVITFSDAKSAQKAFWLSVSGAGKSRSLWKFMGLTAANKKRLEEFAAQQVTTDEVLKVLK